jgi:plasmid stabilization system protein ParE
VTVVRWTDQAVEDLRSIRLFIERDSPRYGRLVAERLYEATSQIELFPYSGRMVPELGREDIRELIVGDYHIV